MNEGILLSALFLSLLGGQTFSKMCSNGIPNNSKSGYAMFLAITGFTACIFFAAISGFKLTLNALTVWYSFAYAACVCLSLICQLKAYQYADISSVTAVKSACSLITTSVVGCLLFNENITPVNILRVVMMLSVIILIFVDVKKNSAQPTEQKRQNTAAFFFIVIILIAATSGSVILMKYYTITPNVASNNSFFFFVNVLLFLFCAVWFIAINFRHPMDAAEKAAILKPGYLMTCVGNTVCSNLNSLFGIILLAKLEVSVYSSVSSALGIIGGIVLSIIFREKFGIYAICAALLSIIAVII